MGFKTKIDGYVKLIRDGKKYSLISMIITDFARIPFYILPSPDGLKVMEEEWDYLILLDGCRLDTFRDMNDIPGNLKKVKSFGSQTVSWLKGNFKEYYEDVVYVSSAPTVSRKAFHGFRGSDHFFKVIDAWQNSDEKLKVTLPDEVTRQALDTIKKYPDKRVIIHYIQPHVPYIGETKIPMTENYLEELARIKIWDNEMLQRAYEDNLRLVLGEVKKLIASVDPDKKIVITADHGDHIGRIPFTHHPHHIHIPQLINVPWLNVDRSAVGKERDKYEKNSGSNLRNKTKDIVNGLKI